MVEERPHLYVVNDDKVSSVSTIGTKRKKDAEWSCSLCRVSATSKRALDEHLKGKKHKRKETEYVCYKNAVETQCKSSCASMDINKQWICALCQVRTTCKDDLENHLRGKQHKLSQLCLMLQKDDEIACAESNETCISMVVNVGGNMLENDGKENGASYTTAEFTRSREDACASETDAEHIKPEAKGPKKNELYCQLCKVKCNSEQSFVEHCKGKRHVAKVGKL